MDGWAHPLTCAHRFSHPRDSMGANVLSVSDQFDRFFEWQTHLGSYIIIYYDYYEAWRVRESDNCQLSSHTMCVRMRQPVVVVTFPFPFQFHGGNRKIN